MKLNPMEWKSVGSGRWRAQTSTCCYDIWHQWASDGFFRASIHVAPYTDIMIGGKGGFSSLEMAQDASQKDYEDRISTETRGNT